MSAGEYKKSWKVKADKKSKVFRRAIDILNVNLKIRSLARAVDYHPLVIDSNKNQNKAEYDNEL